MIGLITILIILVIIFVPYLVGKAINPFSETFFGYWCGGILNIIFVGCALFVIFGIFLVIYNLVTDYIIFLK